MHTPITAIVIFRNEQRHLRRCLAGLRWCNEIIAVDMASSDGSLEVARELADRVYQVDAFPIAEPTRVAAAKLATHDWVLLVDPDEEIPLQLATDIRRALREHPDAGALCLPMWFYFKGKRLTGTVWGTLTHKRRLIHRRRCTLLPLCNRLNQLDEGYADVVIPHDGDNHMLHFWSDSYMNLLWKHLRRYSHLEAAAMVARGERFTWRKGLIHPLVDLYKCLRHFDGWRIGPRGWILSAINFGYVAASHWLMLWYQRRPARLQQDTTVLPELRPDSLHIRRRAA
jgi:glycosyltransferase involved in cell wall biosynthesis